MEVSPVPVSSGAKTVGSTETPVTGSAVAASARPTSTIPAPYVSSRPGRPRSFAVEASAARMADSPSDGAAAATIAAAPDTIGAAIEVPVRTP